MDITEMVVKLSRTGAGSVVMWFMVFLSVISITFIVERAIYFTKFKSKVADLSSELQKLFSLGKLDDAKKLLENDEGFESRVLRATLDHIDQGAASVREIAASASLIERSRYEKRLAFLGTLGNNAPFIGLFGTVLEIIAALFELGTQSGANASAGAVMSTLSAALAATAVGLLVALPAVASFNYFNRLLKSMQNGADALVHLLVAHLVAQKDNTKGA
jgi:biopolymer transport protein ExbB